MAKLDVKQKTDLRSGWDTAGLLNKPKSTLSHPPLDPVSHVQKKNPFYHTYVLCILCSEHIKANHEQHWAGN